MVLTAGWLAGWQINTGKFQICKKFIMDQIFNLFAAFNKVTALLEKYKCV